VSLRNRDDGGAQAVLWLPLRLPALPPRR